jgi:hypothetical protein
VGQIFVGFEGVFSGLIINSMLDFSITQGIIPAFKKP